VGRNLLGHAYCGAYGLFDEVVYDDVGPGACVAICDYNHHNDGIIGGGLLANEFIRMPYLFAGAVHPERRVGNCGATPPTSDTPWWGSIRNLCSSPVRSIRRDGPLIPVAHLGHGHPEDQVRISVPRAEWVKAAGAHRLENKCGSGPMASGGRAEWNLRMRRPRTSVVNRYGQVHEIDNLFVADTACVTSWLNRPDNHGPRYWVSNIKRGGAERFR
jgi:hypothetical protein